MADKRTPLTTPGTTPRVSVIIAAYNATATLRRTVESVLAQTMGDWEAIIINDASTDGTLAMAKELARKDKRVRVLELEKNSGQSTARNRGFAEAKGEWVAVLDADDAYTPERLDVMLAHAEANRLDMVADSQQFYDAVLGRVSRDAVFIKEPVRAWRLAEHLREEKIGRAFKWGLLKPMIRRSFLEQHQLGYRPQFNMGEDSLLYMEILAKGAKAEILARPMYVYTTARGEISGMASGFSTSRYRFEMHYGTYVYFRDHYARQMTAGERQALEGGMRAAVDSEQSALFKADVKRKRMAAALKRLLKHPGLALFVAQGVWKFVRFRLPYKVMRAVKRRTGK